MAWRVAFDGHSSKLWDPAVVAVSVTLLCLTLSWVPSYSFDETIGLAIVDRSPGQLFGVLKNIDAVHGLYYLALQAWTDIFGAQPFSARFMSSVAIGLAAGVTSVIGRLLVSRQAGLLAGLLLGFIPRANWAATEARPYAATVLAAACLTLMLLVALRRRQNRWWIAYALVAALSTGLFIYSVFLVAAHALAVWTMDRRRVRNFLLAGTAGVLLASPVIYFAIRQSGQVSWIRPVGPWTLGEILKGQWFLSSAPSFLSMSLLLGAGCFIAIRRLASTRSAGTLTSETTAGVGTAVLLCAWLVVPLAGVLAVSVLISPVYSPRYMSNTTPALALLMAWGIVSLSKRAWIRLAVTAVIAALAVPALLSARQPYAKDSDYSHTARWMQGKTLPDDAVIFARPGYPQSMRVVMYADETAFLQLDDVMEKTSIIEGNSYWPEEYPFGQLEDRLAGRERVWVILANETSFESTDIYAELTRLGYVSGESIQGRFSGAVVMSRQS